MKKKLKIIVTILLIGLIFSACSKQTCPTYAERTSIADIA